MDKWSVLPFVHVKLIARRVRSLDASRFDTRAYALPGDLPLARIPRSIEDV